MNKWLYPRLALSNLRKSRRFVVPYILAGGGAVAMLYIVGMLAMDNGLDNMFAGYWVSMLMAMGLGVVMVFGVIFMLYINSFIQRQRLKEFGLYAVLGMEKRHMALVLVFEMLFSGLTMLVLGLAAGLGLGKLAFLVLLKLIQMPVPLGFTVSAPALVFCTEWLIGVLVLSLLLNLRRVLRADPIQLLYQGQKGEREPRTRWLLVLLGLLTMGGGYATAWLVTSPVALILVFFPAAVLVIIGTYCLFTAGSVAVLKALRRDRRYYYQPRHFITVSGLLYRMKQNAAGLASICILSTMVLVMMICTVSLYSGVSQSLDMRYPMQFCGSLSDTAPAKQVVEESGVQILRQYEYESITFAGQLVDDVLVLDGTDGTVCQFYAITTEGYTSLTGKTLTLEPGQALFSSQDGEAWNWPTLTIGDTRWEIVGSWQAPIVDGRVYAYMVPVYYLVVPTQADLEALAQFQQKAYGKHASEIATVWAFDTACTEMADIAALKESIQDAIRNSDLSGWIDCGATDRQEGYAMYGGFLFLGLTLGLVFLLATALIIYYKQVSEGYDDRQRFHILQQVGMSRKEVQATIRTQVLTVFFLPLITAGIHTAAAFPAMTRMLSVLGIGTNRVTVYAVCGLAAFGVFSLIYVAVYALTARAYARIVG